MNDKVALQLHGNRIIIITFLIIYCSACFALIQTYHLAVSDLLSTVFCFGVLLSAVAYWLTANQLPRKEKPFRRQEFYLLPLLLIWIIVYITFGSTLVNRILPATTKNNDQILFVFIIIKKLFVFFLVPFACYKLLKFHLKDFGLKLSKKHFLDKKNWTIFFVFSLLALVFEYYFGGGTATIREHKFSFMQLSKAIPLCFLWLFIEVGLVEEFFYRAIIQSRLTSWFKSAWAGILTGGLLFALSHLPGLYLRGAESEGIDRPRSILFWASFCIANMSVAGIALGIVWWRTKNLYLVMALHAVIDLLPNLSFFIATWHL